MDLSYVSTGIVRKLIKDQDRFKWFLAFNQNKNYDISESLSYNVEMMGNAVGKLKCMQPENVVQPADAQIQDTGRYFRDHSGGCGKCTGHGENPGSDRRQQCSVEKHP